MENNAHLDEMKTMVSCLNNLVRDGYTDDFKATELGLLSMKSERKYAPREVHLVNFYRFEGASDPADNSILYVIETDDGIKGTLIDAYGTYADPLVNDFIDQIPEINKRPQREDNRN